MDLTLDEGKDKGRRTVGIFKVEGDTLTMSLYSKWGLCPKRDRPKSLESKSGNKVLLYKFKRL